MSEPDTRCLVLFSHTSTFGSGSELRKSSGWTGDALGLEEFCVTTCLVWLAKTVVQTGLCCQVDSWGTESGRKRENSAAPTGSYLAFSVSLHWSSISCIRRFGCALFTSTVNGLLHKKKKKKIRKWPTGNIVSDLQGKKGSRSFSTSVPPTGSALWTLTLSRHAETTHSLLATVGTAH